MYSVKHGQGILRCKFTNINIKDPRFSERQIPNNKENYTEMHGLQNVKMINYYK